MANKALVTWLICCNRPDASAIGRTLLSVFKQDFASHSIVFVSNGSQADRVDAIAANFLRNAPIPFVQLSTSVSGLTFSLNLGLSYCDSEFVARLDVGDEAMESRLRVQVEILRTYSTDVIGVGSQYRTETSDTSWVSKLPLTSERIASELWRTSTLCHPSILMRVSELQASGGYEGFPFSEDFELWLRLTREGYKFVNSGDCLLLYEASGGAARGNPNAYAGIAAYFLYELITAPSKRSVLGLGTYLAKYCYVRLRNQLFGKRK